VVIALDKHGVNSPDLPKGVRQLKSKFSGVYHDNLLLIDIYSPNIRLAQ
jgi:hypothetical protein